MVVIGALLYALAPHERGMDLVYGAERRLVCPNNGYKIGDAPVMTKIRCTCYVDSGTTASGQKVRNGIIAGKREWMGKTVALYAINDKGEVREFIGFFEILDTGAGIDTDRDGKGDSITNGMSIDVWRQTLADCNAWVKEYGDYVYMQMLESEG